MNIPRISPSPTFTTYNQNYHNKPNFKGRVTYGDGSENAKRNMKAHLEKDYDYSNLDSHLEHCNSATDAISTINKLALAIHKGTPKSADIRFELEKPKQALNPKKGIYPSPVLGIYNQNTNDRLQTVDIGYLPPDLSKKYGVNIVEDVNTSLGNNRILSYTDKFFMEMALGKHYMM